MNSEESAALFPAVADHMRMALTNLHMAAAQAVPADAREDSPALDRWAAVMDQSYYLLLRMVNNLSDAGYLTGEKKIHPKDCDLANLVGDVCTRSIDLAEDMGLYLGFRCPMDHCPAYADPEALRMALYQLLSNAVKFTPAGGSITVELKADGDTARILVSDTGPGIPEEQLATIFERYRHPERMDPPPHGLGLGLALCLGVAQAHGGRMLVESRKGCRVTMELPVLRRERPEIVFVHDVLPVYGNGFNPTLLGLADALPSQAFLIRSVE